jgi:hypothetical protein
MEGMRLKGFEAIGRATGVKPASRRHERRYEFPVEFDRRQGQKIRQPPDVYTH